LFKLPRLRKSAITFRFETLLRFYLLSDLRLERPIACFNHCLEFTHFREGAVAFPLQALLYLRFLSDLRS